MIVVRDIFQLKFGAKGAIDLWRQVIEANQKLGYGNVQSRLLTDLVGGPYYTVVLETTFESMAQFEKAIKDVLASAEWRAIYDKLVPMIESGRREILSVAG